MVSAVADLRPSHWLMCRARKNICALPIEDVVEIMRPLPIEPMPAVPTFVAGLSIVRGAPVCVIDAGILLGGGPAQAGRLVIAKAGGRTVGLAVDEVFGVRAIGAGQVGELPPLIREAVGDAVAAIGRLDSELLLLLRAARLVPDTLLDELVGEEPAL